MAATGGAASAAGGQTCDGDRQTARVSILATNGLAAAALYRALAARPGVDVVWMGHPSDAALARQCCGTDVVIADLTLGEPVVEVLSRVTRACPDVVLVSLVLGTSKQYAWVRARATGTLFAVEAAGVGPLDAVIHDAGIGEAGIADASADGEGIGPRAVPPAAPAVRFRSYLGLAAAGVRADH